MTDSTPQPISEKPNRWIIAAGIAAAAHVFVFLAALVARSVVRPSAGGGMQDLAAASATFLGGEALIGVGALVGGAVLFSRGHRYLGVGLLGGWIVGLIVVSVLFCV